MTNAAHTPGPWLCSGTSVSNPQANRPNAIICDVSGWGNRDGAEQIANARLIAAAPDLLAALHDADELCQQGLNSPHAEHWEASLYDIMDLVRAAIAKAKGE